MKKWVLVKCAGSLNILERPASCTCPAIELVVSLVLLIITALNFTVHPASQSSVNCTTAPSSQ